MANEPRVAIIVLNWNGADDTIKCVNSLLKLTYQNRRIIIVDNASEGDDVLRINTSVGQYVELIENSVNSGYAGGNNTGMRHALNGDCDYIWVLNNDVTVDPNSLSALVSSTDNNFRLGVIGSTIYFPGKSKLYCIGGGLINLWTGVDRLIGAGKKISLDRVKKPRHLDYINGAAFFLSTKVIRRIGMFDEAFFLYSEESDFCQRARQVGFQIDTATDSVIEHASAQSSQHLSKTYIYYFLRSKLIFQKKHGHWWQWPTFTLVFLIYYCLGFGIKSWAVNRNARFSVITQAIIDFLHGRLGKREIQPQRRLHQDL